jgi:hypothetical protein
MAIISDAREHLPETMTKEYNVESQGTAGKILAKLLPEDAGIKVNGFGC